ncbi:S41 family peptidase [Solimonas sp. K1W22B-7]|uniref:S41 family peptidase n=1 Tax=Solimonas sp. K1W22B-7 TaxID=2303331 RepID=UPI0013C4A0A7|nr:S41 family peptidase [Solimonas sp. K1W22B-7]
MLQRGSPWNALIPRALLLGTVLTLVTACGGGGGGSDGGGGAERLGASAKLAQVCAVPRSGSSPITGRRYRDVQGALADERAWLAAYMQQVYLFYRDIPAVDGSLFTATRYGSPQNAMGAYFYSLLTPQRTSSGKERDAYSFVYPTLAWEALSEEGRVLGYGMTLSWPEGEYPTIAQVDPGKAAATAGLLRGLQILAVDGDDASAATRRVYDGLFPETVGERHRLTVRNPGTGASSDYLLDSMELTLTPVRNVKVLPTAGTPVGYLQFDDHIDTSEGRLIDAIGQLKAAGVGDLVLDMRYNGGGYLDIAAELAYMVAGPAQTAGKVFTLQQFNDHHPYRNDPLSDTPFHSRSQGFDPAVPAGRELPQLGLSRVFVLVTGDTCSASEALVNGLRGAGIQVVLVGSATCGKPYGFFAQDNCGMSYFAIEFRGVNQLGFGDYADGMPVTCAADDDFGHALGDPAEGMLAGALYWRQNGNCAASLAKRGSLPPRMIREPQRQNAWLR